MQSDYTESRECERTRWYGKYRSEKLGSRSCRQEEIDEAGLGYKKFDNAKIQENHLTAFATRSARSA